jgi:hypothetical protein
MKNSRLIFKYIEGQKNNKSIIFSMRVGTKHKDKKLNLKFYSRHMH